MNKNEKTGVVAVVVIAILAIGWIGGFFAQWGIPAPTFSFNGGNNNNNYTPTDQDKENWKNGIGRWQVYESFVDSLDTTTARTSVTNYVCQWWTKKGSLWVFQKSGNNQLVSLDAGDGGYLYAVVSIPSAQAYYVDFAKIKQSNSYIVNWEYTDVGSPGDGVKEFAFQIDMKGHQLPNSGYPEFSFNGFLKTYDASFTGLNDLANSTAILTTTVTKFYDYYLAFSAVKKNVALWKVEVKIGTTDESKVRLKKLNVPGIGYLDGSSFDKIYTATDYRYTYTIGRDFATAAYIGYGSNTNNKFDATLQLEYTLASSDDILITTTFYYFVAQTEASTSTSDFFYAQE